jgi:hypothetical protein
MPPLLDHKNPAAPSVFRPAALLREARRQKGIPTVDVPAICILDPDGDMVRRLRRQDRSKPFEGWPCYHTQLEAFELATQTVGIVGCAVGARQANVLCVAHVTNAMGQAVQDFEKGTDDGTGDALQILEAIVRATGAPQL